MDNIFFKYNKTNIIDKPNDIIIYSSNTIDCINSCELNENCKGVVISHPICENNLPFSECIGLINDIDILNSRPENLYNSKCKFMTNIDNRNNIINNSSKDTSYIKTKYSNMLNSNIDSSKLYYLKINNLYLSINSELGLLFLTTSNDIESAGLFKFNSDGNIIETKSQKCLQINGEYIILTECGNNIKEQKFIYENKFNSIRPIATLDKNNSLCLSLGLEMDNRIELEECVYSQTQNIQNIQFNENTKLEINQMPYLNTNKLESTDKNENFSSLKQLEKKIENIDFCSNPVYKTIVFLIILGILIYFIWFVSRKNYLDDNDIEVSTPFK